MFARISRSLHVHGQIYAYVLGSALISVWALLRFFDQRMTFDLVGQQVLGRQWLHGHLAGATIGPTNYILKMLFLYIPLDWLPGSPRLKLILIALAIDIVTLVCIGILLKRILAFFGIKPNHYLHLSILWLSALAGSVFWVQFSNSRNLEVVGGLWLVERGLVFMQRPTRRLMTAIAALAAVLFFADNLQVYMTAVPVLSYSGCLAVKARRYRKVFAGLAGAIIVGIVAAKLLMSLVARVFLIHFLSGRAPAPDWSVHAVMQSLRGTIIGFGHLFAGASDAGRLREAANLAVAGLLGLGFIYASVRKWLPKRLIFFVISFIAIDAAVYMASGQALQAGTSRYLIMAAPVALLAFSSLGQLPWAAISLHRLLTVSLGIVVAINVVMLSHALVTHWHTDFPLDKHLYSVEDFSKRGDYKVVYTSMDTALPLNYLTGQRSTIYLPLVCAKGQLLKSRLFFDSSAFSMAIKGQRFIPVVLDGNAITNTPSTCLVDGISRQLGSPTSTTTTDDGSTVLLYEPGSFTAPKIFN